jgi:AbrB family transcriptional regulator (stage V sporulation protein T)
MRGKKSMKATGIIRRIDELGRIVIPKEIRKSLRMREGTPIEIFMGENEQIVLKKYSPLNELKDFSKEAVEAIFASLEHPTLLVDKDEVLHVAGVRKTEYINKTIGLEVEKIIANRKPTLLNKKENASMCALIKDDQNEYSAQLIVPIHASGDTYGAIILFEKDENAEFTIADGKAVSLLANFLAKQFE